MARIKIEAVIDHLSSEVRNALVAAVEDVAPDAEVDEYELFRAFKRAVSKKCTTWERVPDRCVEV